MNKRLCVVCGTRPDIIKLSPIIRYCTKNSIDFTLIHSGQHYDTEMDEVFFDELDIKKPDINLRSSFDLNSNGYLDQTAVIMNKFKRVFIEELIDIVLVLGDTNSALAASIIARRLSLKLAHVEAGLRSFDWRMQEEHNRIMIDHISDLKFAPTKSAFNNLIRETIPKNTVYLTGNTIVDAVHQNLDIAIKKSRILEKLGLKQKFILVTSHRPENVDDPTRLSYILDGISRVADTFNYTVVFPAHPRTLKRMREFNIKPPKNIMFIEPPGYLDFLSLENFSILIITDSGGVQEEACILKRPCVTIRETTERPETLNIGCNALAGVNPDRIVQCVKEMLHKSINYSNPFGDGKSSVYIMKILEKV